MLDRCKFETGNISLALNMTSKILTIQNLIEDPKSSLSLPLDLSYV
jgi:hypothetical protein